MRRLIGLVAQTETSGAVPKIPGYGELVKIGSGGYSQVYRARQHEFGRPVAIKVLNSPLESEDAVAAFERECQAMGALWDHPNIVPVYTSAFTSDERPCIVMKLFHEGSYSQVLRKHGPLALAELLLVGVKIAGALASAHDAGVLHGDVKPHNIFKSKFGEPALGDFGIATFVGRQGANARRGLSVHYAAPESVEGVPGPKADQYSLAATIFTLAVGKRPFEGSGDTGSDSNTQVLLRVLESATPSLPEQFPEPFRDAVRQAMDREPDQRHEDVSAFAAALAEVELGLGLRRTSFPATEELQRANVPETGHAGAARTDELMGSAVSDESTTAKEAARTLASGDEPLVGDAPLARTSATDISRPSSHDSLAAEVAEVTKPRTDTGSKQLVEARECVACEHPHPPSASECLSCGASLNRRSSKIVAIPQPRLGTVRLSGGRIESLDADLVIGRQPTRESLEPHQRGVTAGEDDRTISRRHLEVQLDGWELNALILGKHTKLERQGLLSAIERGTVIKLMLGDTLYFGTKSWLRYTSNYSSVGSLDLVDTSHGPSVRDQAAAPASDGQSDASMGGDDVAPPSEEALSQASLGIIELSNGRTEILDADLVIGRNPIREPLAPDQRAVVHGEGDRTISRRHLALRRKAGQIEAQCLGDSIFLERNSTIRELSSGVTERLESNDTIHYGTDSWLRYNAL